VFAHETPIETGHAHIGGRSRDAFERILPMAAWQPVLRACVRYRLPRFIVNPLLTIRHAISLQRLRHEIDRSIEKPRVA
jgi:hypothetical protein